MDFQSHYNSFSPILSPNPFCMKVVYHAGRELEPEKKLKFGTRKRGLLLFLFIKDHFRARQMIFIPRSHCVMGLMVPMNSSRVL